MKTSRALAATGVPGLDELLKGGLPQKRLYLLRGEPGVGKTTLAMQFLLEGERRGEHGLYITLSETADEIRDIAESHDWDLGQLRIFELSALEEQLAQDTQNTMFHPAEVELNRTTELLLKVIDEAKPRRLVLDSLSELRLLSDTALRYRRQMLSFKQFFAGRDITVMLLDDHAVGGGDLHVQSIAHGVISLDTVESEYGAERRRLKINKLRGVGFVGGYHDARIVAGGLQVFPRLVAADHKTSFEPGVLKSGIEALDHLLGGGIDRGTSCLILGPPGTGKSTLAAQFATKAASHGDHVLMCLFEENKRTLEHRSASISSPIGKYIQAGNIEVRQVDPGELAPGQFVNFVLEAVEARNARLVIIDSLNAYLQAMPGVKFLNVQLHELLAFLSHRGVVSVLNVAQHGVLGSSMHSPVDLTYLADSVLLLRFFEHAGQIKKAVSVLKKRVGRHESTIRELSMDGQGIRIGDPLKEFEGVLTGIPQFKGSATSMLRNR
jgi:circadian clock protein KaiC